ncbi:GDSL-type esterase/lipase family protein [Sporolactobacillus pectinivorans]|uniref:GDSL-type esterase/lipase family protein n=1 Tax=Sporolactobacillus pectinivorans TaxID=1591408 RepID=UPI001EFE404B|nr:GDSL-type esterase/lipase family protein [Sporolactobacillus pectinivorans]
MNENPLYVALGDSLTVGVGSTFFQPNFVKYYQKSIEYYFRHPVRKLVFAKNGATTQDILSFFSRPEVAGAVHDATFITLTGGGNDLLHARKKWLKFGESTIVSDAIQQCLYNMALIIESILRLRGDVQKPVTIRVLNLYNPMFQIPESRAWLETYNRSLFALERYPSVQVADVYSAFYGHEPYLLSMDHTHPNPVGYRVMAEVAADLGFEPVADSRGENEARRRQ